MSLRTVLGRVTANKVAVVIFGLCLLACAGNLAPQVAAGTASVKQDRFSSAGPMSVVEDMKVLTQDALEGVKPLTIYANGMKGQVMVVIHSQSYQGWRYLECHDLSWL